MMCRNRHYAEGKGLDSILEGGAYFSPGREGVYGGDFGNMWVVPESSFSPADSRR